MTTPMQDTVCSASAKSSHGDQCEVSSFSHSGDILGGIEKLNGSHEHNHTHFRDGLSSRCVPNLKSLCSPITKIWQAKKNTDIGVVWGLWVTQGNRQHSHSIVHIWLPIRL